MRLLSEEDINKLMPGKSRSQRNRLIAKGRFPKPVYHGRTPAWIETEINDYIEGLIAERDRNRLKSSEEACHANAA